MESPLYVVTRSGERQPVRFDAITQRVERLAAISPPLAHVDPVRVAQRVVSGVRPGVTTRELDELAAETAAYMGTLHPDYGALGGRIATSNLQKQLPRDFSRAVARIEASGGVLSREFCETVARHAARLDAALVPERDYALDYFGFRTAERSYLVRVDGAPAETFQHMLMRVAVGIHGDDVDAAIETYEGMSLRRFVHASPTLFNAGTISPQLSSCFLVATIEDSIEGIYDTLKRCAQISKYGGGIGVAVSRLRATGSRIRGTNGRSNGLIPWLRLFNDTARSVDQGGGKRKGAIAAYLEPWHPDVEDFLELRKNQGAEDRRARDLFLGLWVPDLFMRRVKADGRWSLFCPDEAPGLADVWGDAFDALYERYEREGRARRDVRAQDLWSRIVDAQIETGNPYVLFKDACNRKSNQQHLGTIQCSNLCTEILEYSSPEETAVCNLASLSLPAFVPPSRDGFDFDALARAVRTVTRNLDRVINRTLYPDESARRSNLRHRPIGIGVQGLADVFALLRLAFDSEGAAALNARIFEAIYHAALDASCALAEELGAHASYAGSPVSRGVLQHDAWEGARTDPELGLDWAGLRARIARHGVRNSLLVAPMPTASTSQILGNCECYEPYASNMFVRRVLAGEFPVVNPHLVRELEALGLWTDGIRNRIVAANGSVQAIEEIPAGVRSLFRTAWELKQRTLVDLALARAPFVDQGQSLNCFMAEPTRSKLTSLLFYAWERGAKNGVYYCRTRPAADAIKFTVDPAPAPAPACRRDDPSCIACSA